MLQCNNNNNKTNPKSWNKWSTFKHVLLSANKLIFISRLNASRFLPFYLHFLYILFFYLFPKWIIFFYIKTILKMKMFITNFIFHQFEPTYTSASNVEDKYKKIKESEMRNVENHPNAHIFCLRNDNILWFSPF